jgi:low affinity Fe/Cu permease
MPVRSTATARSEPGGGRLIDERGHVADTIRREPPWFARLSNTARNVAGSPSFSGLLLLAVLIWLAIGPLTGFSRAWELAATAGAPIIGLMLLVVIQHTQNRDDKAIQLKLNEVIRASAHASDGLISIEDSAEVELSLLLLDYQHHAEADRRRAASPDTADKDTAAQSGLRRWLLRVDGRDRPGRRQRRHYAQGDLGPEHSFIFRSPEGRLNVRAQNLVVFTRLGEAVDDATWLYHLQRGDYSRWFREVIQDEALGREAARLEGPDSASAEDSRRRITSAIMLRYRLAA